MWSILNWCSFRKIMGKSFEIEQNKIIFFTYSVVVVDMFSLSRRVTPCVIVDSKKL